MKSSVAIVIMLVVAAFMLLRPGDSVALESQKPADRRAPEGGQDTYAHAKGLLEAGTALVDSFGNLIGDLRGGAPKTN